MCFQFGSALLVKLFLSFTVVFVYDIVPSGVLAGQTLNAHELYTS